jgi:hypothetical protein
LTGDCVGAAPFGACFLFHDSTRCPRGARAKSPVRIGCRNVPCPGGCSVDLSRPCP